MRRLSLHSSVFEHFKRRKVERWSSFYLHQPTLAKCLAFRPSPFKNERKLEPDELMVRCVARFHPGLRYLGSALNSVMQEWSPIVSAAVGVPIRLRTQCSFKCAGPPLHVVARRSFQNSGGVRGGWRELLMM